MTFHNAARYLTRGRLELGDAGCGLNRYLALWMGSIRLDEFDAVAEGVIDIAALVSGQRLVLDDRVARLLQPPHQCRQINDQQSRMSLARRAEVLFDTEVDPQSAMLEPTAFPRRETARLGHLGDTEHARLERAPLPGGIASWTWCNPSTRTEPPFKRR
jgi:hypothetical protein